MFYVSAPHAPMKSIESQLEKIAGVHFRKHFLIENESVVHHASSSRVSSGLLFFLVSRILHEQSPAAVTSRAWQAAWGRYSPWPRRFSDAFFPALAGHSLCKFASAPGGDGAVPSFCLRPRMMRRPRYIFSRWYERWRWACGSGARPLSPLRATIVGREYSKPERNPPVQASAVAWLPCPAVYYFRRVLVTINGHKRGSLGLQVLASRCAGGGFLMGVRPQAWEQIRG